VVCWGIFFKLLTLSKKTSNFALNALPLAKRTKKTKQSKEELLKFLQEKGTQFSKELKQKATKWELLFKDILEELGYKFEFQLPVICNGKHLYILDFLLIDYQIFIELDGAQHFTKLGLKKDNLRTRRLRKEGYQPLRFPNKQVETLTTEQIKGIIETKISLLKLA
jgi:very-short-patch-repair endonuclease